MARANHLDILVPMSHILNRFLRNTLFMGCILLISIGIYLWNSPKVVDYPEFDESGYFFRAVNLAQGNTELAAIDDIRTSPLMVLLYWFWYTVLDTSLVYPWVLITSVVLMGVGMYTLLSRLFHPGLSWLLALLTVIVVTPTMPQLANYYFGVGLLWLGLSLLGGGSIWRAVGLIVVILASYVRQEYNITIILLVIGLAYYEWRSSKSRQVLIRRLLPYSPVVILLLFTGILWLRAPDATNRAAQSFAWSYNDYYRVKHPDQFTGVDDYGDPWVIFEKDFGRTHSVWRASVSHPIKFGRYLIFNGQELIDALRTAAFDTYRWKLTAAPIDTGNGTRPVGVEFRDNAWHFNFAMLLWGILAVSAYRTLKADNRIGSLHFRRNIPVVIGLLSLTPLVVATIAVTPQQRYYMALPLLWLPIGYGWTCIIHQMRLPSWVLAVSVLLVIVLLPQPFEQPITRPVADTLTFVREHVPNNSTIISPTAWTYRNYLYGEGINLPPIDSTQLDAPVLVNAYQSHPELKYVLLTPYQFDYQYEQWFGEWQVVHPELSWVLVAEDLNLGLRLYELSNDGNIETLGWRTASRRAPR